MSVTAFSTFTIWLIKTVKSAVGKTTYSALFFVLHKNITDVIYIHVPFCLRRCIYCDFYSTTYSTHIRQKYVESLCCELVNRQSYLPSKTIRTIYFGGGTPSQLTIEEIEKFCIAYAPTTTSFRTQKSPSKPIRMTSTKNLHLNCDALVLTE